MPWKGETDPYKIWLSEIILQQTRVAQGLPYYNGFTKAYPTIKDLAAAPDTAVFKLWEGLGYYSRCRNLLACARQVAEKHQGIFPSKYQEILALKGVGPYTAAAISSFAFGLPHAVVDGNVVRVLSRYFGIETGFDTTNGKQEFFALANELLPKDKPAAFNQAIMDFGAVVCTPADPNCENCPLQKNCFAYKAGRVKDFPVKEKKMIKKHRFLTYFIIKAHDKILVRQRMLKDIWQNLHEFYLVETTDVKEWEAVSAKTDISFAEGLVKQVSMKSAIFRQKLTHQTVNAKFIEVECTAAFCAPAGYEWLEQNLLSELAFPRIITAYLASEKNQVLTLF